MQEFQKCSERLCDSLSHCALVANCQYFATRDTKMPSFTKPNNSLKQADFESFLIMNYDAKLQTINNNYKSVLHQQ